MHEKPQTPCMLTRLALTHVAAVCTAFGWRRYHLGNQGKWQVAYNGARHAASGVPEVAHTVQSASTAVLVLTTTATCLAGA
mmetsp:Transcript_81732/g.162231  ORF Transcript_81732/g.162231 Transcript_81732/m.162231 type:complete len:81 (+) Transcript_81732:255-497(+)